jgi:7-carboxy-7-deazaguanine synthase
MNREGWIYLNDVYPAIQGEGSMTGIPMTMLRLHGCGVGCPWCDTKETWDFTTENPAVQVDTIPEILGKNPRFTHQHPAEIAAYLVRNLTKMRWVLLSGGEPAEQDLKPLVAELKQAGYKIALETSGTATGHLSSSFDWVTVSPKFDMPGGKTVLPDVVKQADEIKHVVGKYADIEKLSTYLNRNHIEDANVCLQPVSQSIRATTLAINECMERGWRLSVQVHKYLNLP